MTDQAIRIATDEGQVRRSIIGQRVVDGGRQGRAHAQDKAFVRGDAYRLVGHELDARRAFAQALRPSAEPLPNPGSDPTDVPPDDAPDAPASEGVPE